MAASTRFLLLAVGVAAAAAVVMLPRQDEWLAMMRDENRQAQIISLLEPQLARNSNDTTVLIALGRAYGEIGNYRRAAELLEQYTALRHDDPEALTLLADLYHRSGDPTHEIATLRLAIAIAPTLPRIAELARLYQGEQLAEAELALLSRCETLLTVPSGLVLRLAELRAGKGDNEAAIRVLMRGEAATQVLPEMSNTENERLLLARLLIKAGRSAEAVQLGKEWVAQWRSSWLAARLLKEVAFSAPTADASELADAVMLLHPDIRFFLVRDFAAGNAKPVALHLLEAWFRESPSPSANEVAAFLSACREQDEPRIVWQTFAAMLSNGASNDTLALVSEGIVAEFGIGALAPFWSRLPQEVVEQKSLLAAQLAYHDHDVARARWLLQRADVGSLGIPEQRAWFDLFTSIAPPTEVFDFLQHRRHAGGLSTALLADYARLAGELGQESEYRAAVADLGGKAN